MNEELVCFLKEVLYISYIYIKPPWFCIYIDFLEKKMWFGSERRVCFFTFAVGAIFKVYDYQNIYLKIYQLTSKIYNAHTFIRIQQTEILNVA